MCIVWCGMWSMRAKRSWSLFVGERCAWWMRQPIIVIVWICVWYTFLIQCSLKVWQHGEVGCCNWFPFFQFWRRSTGSWYNTIALDIRWRRGCKQFQRRTLSVMISDTIITRTTCTECWNHYCWYTAFGSRKCRITLTADCYTSIRWANIALAMYAFAVPHYWRHRVNQRCSIELNWLDFIGERKVNSLWWYESFRVSIRNSGHVCIFMWSDVTVPYICFQKYTP